MNNKTKFYLAVAVSAAGVVLWSARQAPCGNQPEHTLSSTTVERNVSTKAVCADLKQSERTALQAEPSPVSRPSSVIDVTESTFSSMVFNSDQPVLVDFGSLRCGACQILEPVIHELATELGGQAVVAQVDVEENPRLAEHFGIRALPTLLVFKDGQVVDKVVGAAPKGELRERIESHIDRSASVM